MDSSQQVAQHAPEAKRQQPTPKDCPMAKKSRGGRMTAAKNRAAKSAGGKGPVKKRPAGRKIMKT
ncbi:MAG: hypothetical protein ABIZ49_03260 [Opitutaceae bacterium]